MSAAISHPVQSEEQLLQQRTSRRRLFPLDTLRGMAAVMVGFSHLLLAIPRTFEHWDGVLFSLGRSAVVLFFVLSGYVLSLPYWGGRPQPYGRYLIRRFCRIYLPFTAAALIAVFAAYHFRNVHAVHSAWFEKTWTTPITPGRIALQFLMVPMPDFNTAFWSLTYEMQMSILMPLLCWLLMRLQPVLCTTVLGALLFVVPFGAGRTAEVSYPRMSLQVLFLFCLGASLAYHERPLREACRRAKGWVWVVLALGLFLYLDGPLLLSPGNEEVSHQIFMRDYLINGLGAAAMVVLSLHHPPLTRLLQHGLTEYLGRISYSFYLIHGTILFALFDLLFGRIPNAALAALALVLMFAAAHLFCIEFEEPAMRLGKRLTGTVSAKRA